MARPTPPPEQAVWTNGAGNLHSPAGNQTGRPCRRRRAAYWPFCKQGARHALQAALETARRELCWLKTAGAELQLLPAGVLEVQKHVMLPKRLSAHQVTQQAQGRQSNLMHVHGFCTSAINERMHPGIN